jgi:hypothetical protein
MLIVVNLPITKIKQTSQLITKQPDYQYFPLLFYIIATAARIYELSPFLFAAYKNFDYGYDLQIRSSGSFVLATDFIKQKKLPFP